MAGSANLMQLGSPRFDCDECNRLITAVDFRFARHQDLWTKTASGFLYVLVKRTRTSQKTSRTSGSMVRTKYRPMLNKARGRCCPSPTVESNLSGRFAPPRKKDPAAMNSPKHMRQR